MSRVPPARALLALTGREFAAGGTVVMQTTKTNFQLGSIYALVTAALLATQEPFSASPQSSCLHCLSCVSLKLRCCSRFPF